MFQSKHDSSRFLIHLQAALYLVSLFPFSHVSSNQVHCRTATPPNDIFPRCHETKKTRFVNIVKNRYCRLSNKSFYKSVRHFRYLRTNFCQLFPAFIITKHRDNLQRRFYINSVLLMELVKVLKLTLWSLLILTQTKQSWTIYGLTRLNFYTLRNLHSVVPYSFSRKQNIRKLHSVEYVTLTLCFLTVLCDQLKKMFFSWSTSDFCISHRFKSFTYKTASIHLATRIINKVFAWHVALAITSMNRMKKDVSMKHTMPIMKPIFKRRLLCDSSSLSAPGYK